MIIIISWENVQRSWLNKLLKKTHKTGMCKLKQGSGWLCAMSRDLLKSCVLAKGKKMLNTESDANCHKLHRLTERDSRLAHFSAHEILNKNGLFWPKNTPNELDLTFWTTSGAKSDVIFLVSDPNFIYRRRNFAPISRLIFEIPILGYLGPWGYFWAT